MKQLVLGSIIVLSGCATSFTGSAFVTDGPRGCQARCEETNMEATAFVYIGEYSTACVCGHRGSYGRSTGSDEIARSEGAAAAVMTAMRLAEDHRQQ